jgi:hypothetical protein
MHLDQLAGKRAVGVGSRLGSRLEYAARMRSQHAYVLALLLCCGLSNSCARDRGAEVAVTRGGEPSRLTLVQDRPSRASDVTLTLKSVMEAHATRKGGESVNQLMMVLDATRGAERQTITLERIAQDPPSYTPVYGLELAIDYVDAYHQPLTGAVLVRPQ